jgi:hypothetical protein
MSLRAVEWKLNMEAYRIKKSKQQNTKTTKEVCILDFKFFFNVIEIRLISTLKI